MIAATLALGVLLAIGGRPAAAERARYDVEPADALPRITEVVIERANRDGTLIRVDSRADGRRLFAYEVGGDGAWPDLGAIDRYAVALEDGAPRAFTDARTGEALLPLLPREAWLPRPSPGAVAPDGFFDEGTFLGRTLRRRGGGAPAPIAWTEPRPTPLNTDRLIATSRDFKDDGTGRRGGEWTWTPLREDDYDRMIAAGFNLFRTAARDLPFLVGKPVWLVTTSALERYAGLPLLPTYRGGVMYADEPALHERGTDAFRALRDPERAAARVAERTRETLRGSGRYGRGYLRAQLEENGVTWGGVPDAPYPVWETVASAAWYELEAGADGWCYEARPDPERFARDVLRVTGVALPPTADAWTRVHLALFRGAARRFDAPWGVAIYGQADSAAADALLPAAYDAGATYFWFWTSDGDHHVPHAAQLQLAERLTAHAVAHPRPEGARARTREADVALVLPWGTTFDDDTFSRGGLWGARTLAYDGGGAEGASHRAMLAAAAGETASLLERGALWDILFLRDGESADGYREVRRVRPDGRVEVSP